MEFGRFRKIRHHTDVGGRRALTGRLIEVTEKLDGSQFGFTRTRQGLVFRSSRRIIEDPNDGAFDIAMATINEVQESIPWGLYFYAEYLRKPKHNSITYDRVPKGNLALYAAITDTETCEPLPYPWVQQFAERMGIDSVPLLYNGSSEDVDIKKFIGQESYYGGTNIEGVVIRNIKNGAYAKMVDPAFKERMACKTVRVKGGSKANELFKVYHSPVRWEKMLYKLRDSGELKFDRSDIGTILKAVYIDLNEEVKAEVMNKLWKFYKKSFYKSATDGLADWYIKKLEGGFRNE